MNHPSTRIIDLLIQHVKTICCRKPQQPDCHPAANHMSVNLQGNIEREKDMVQDLQLSVLQVSAFLVNSNI